MIERDGGYSDMTSALVVGNVTVDEIYSVAAVPKLGESVLGNLRLRDIGGKGANVATLLARCGLPTQLISTVGDDERGCFIKDALAVESLTSGLNTDIAVSATTTTDLSLVYSDSKGGSSIVTTVDAAHNLNWSGVETALMKLQQHDLVFLQANLSEALTRRIVRLSNSSGLTIIFNPSPCTSWVKSIIKEVDILFVNEEESQALTGFSNKAAVIALLEQGLRYVVLTLGEHGALFGSICSTRVDSLDSIISVPAVAVNAEDTTGAGDTYLAVAMASASLRGVPLDSTALRHGASAASITVRSHGTQSAFPTVAQLANILAS